MTFKSKILTHLSGSSTQPQSWQDLSQSEKSTAKAIAGTYLFAAFGFAACLAVAKHEIDNTPEECIPVLFPEQTFIEQPEHCHPKNRTKVAPAPLL